MASNLIRASGLALIALVSFSLTSYGQGSGNCLEFDGSNDYVTADDVCNTLNGGPITFSAWIFPTSASSTLGAILAFNEFSDSPTNNVNLLYYQGSTGKIVYFDRAPENYNIPSVGFFPPGYWYHVACTISDGLQGNIFVNGVQVLSFQAEETPVSDNRFSIGQEWDGFGTSGHFKGKIDEVRVWKKCLTQNEVRETMCKSLPASEPLLAACFKLDQNSGFSAFEEISQSNLGTLMQFNGSPWGLSGAPIGDESAFLYPASWAGTNINYPLEAGLALTLENVQNSPAGVHIYSVGSAPNSLTGLSLTPNYYFGIFATNLSAQYSMVLDYSESDFCGNCELETNVFSRNDNDKTTWVPIYPVIDPLDCKAVLGDESSIDDSFRSEYVVDIEATTPVNWLAEDTLFHCTSDTLAIYNPVPGMEILWSTGDTTEVIQVSEPGLYFVFVQIDGCIYQDSVEVIDTLATSGQVNLCLGDTALVFGVPVSDSGTFSQLYSGFNGCDSTSVITVVVLDPIALELNVKKTCPGQSDGSATVIATGGLPPFSYLWSNGTAGTPTLGNLPPGAYSLTATDSNGCINSENFAIEVSPVPEVLLTPNDVTCFGGSDGSLGLAFMDTTLQFSVNGQDFSSGDIINDLSPGARTLWILDGYGCQFSFGFEIGQPEPISILLPSTINLQFGNSAQITAFVQPADGTYSFAWSPPEGLSCSDCPNPVVQGIGSTVYTLVVTDEAGCTAQAFVVVEVDKENIRVFIPNIFSPNGDGRNDWFSVFGGPEVQGVRSLKIFDRWGEKVFDRTDFQANQPSLGWDGTFKGKKKNPGVFAYLAEVEMIGGQIIVFEGSISLLR